MAREDRSREAGGHVDDFDRRWERIQEQLFSQARGDEPPKVVSTRTLFGIKSEVEKKMERFAEEIEEERRDRVEQKRREAAESEGVLMDESAEFVLDVESVVELEQKIAADGTPLSELMRNAGAALASAVREKAPAGGSVVVLCGSGNNGGDGWVASELLARTGCRVTVASVREPGAITAEPARGAARHALETAGEKLAVLSAPGREAVASVLGEADVAVDALLGTGFAHDTLREPLAGWVEALNEAHASGGLYVIAADVASGVSAQTGAAAAPHVVADETVTMMVGKPGLSCGEGKKACGKVRVASICELAPYRAFLEERDVRDGEGS